MTEWTVSAMSGRCRILTCSSCWDNMLVKWWMNVGADYKRGSDIIKSSFILARRWVSVHLPSKQRLKQVLSLCGGWMCPEEEDTPKFSDSQTYNSTGHSMHSFVFFINTDFRHVSVRYDIKVKLYSHRQQPGLLKDTWEEWILSHTTP